MGRLFRSKGPPLSEGCPVSNIDGTGIIDAPTLQLSIDVGIRLTNEIMEGLTQVDLRAAYANCVIAHPSGIIHGVDYQYSGKIERVDTHSLELLLREDFVPVIPPLGFDGEGRTYRVNSDLVALEVGEALHATKLIYLVGSRRVRFGRRKNRSHPFDRGSGCHPQTESRALDEPHVQTRTRRPSVSVRYTPGSSRKRQR